ncbi:MAG TPA: peptidylprolyl isomerase, partial [Gemmatimonadales bacterium]|nr:peptidylprolyl isomerase [Gemmatimonadales bacterium]
MKPCLVLAAGWLLSAGVSAASAAAQQPGIPIDRVIAVVGPAAITFTQLQEEFFTRYAVMGLQPPTDSTRIEREMRELVDTLVNAELLYQGALKDTTIAVSPIEVNDAVDQTMMRLRRQVPSEQSFLTELRRAGFIGIEDYRRWLVEDQHRELIRNRYIENLRGRGEMESVTPTEKEVRAYYESIKDALPPRPPSVNLRQIVIRPVADSAAKLAAFLTADSLARAIRDGADFAVAARRFSQDPGSAQQGGDMDWFRRGAMVRPFEEAAFSLPRGTISNPVETVYGWHVIQVERRVPSEVKVRHILISPQIGDAERQRARALADSLRRLIAAGASFDSLQAIHHDPS